MNKKFTKLMAALALLVFMTPSIAGWGQVSSAAPANGNSYVVAAYVNSKYYALPNGTVNGSTIPGVEITLNSVNKVSTSDATGKTWTLVEGTGTNSGQYYITYTSGSDTYYLYKNGTGGSNYNFAVNKTSKNYWSFTTNGTGYTVAAVDRGSNNINIQCNSGTFRCYSTATSIILLEIGDTPSVPYTVTLGDDNTTLTESSAGAGVTLPSRPDVSPYTFAGWSETNLTEETTTATVIPAGEYHPTDDITLYPIYSRSESGATTWTKDVSSSVAGHPSGITEGVYALLTGSDKAFNGVISSGHGQSTTDAFVFTDNVATSAPTGTCEITMIPVMNGDAILGYKMHNAEYGYLYASAASSGHLAWHDSEDSYWSYSNYDWCYNSNTAHLRVYNDTFRTYGGASNAQIKVARKGTVTTTYYISVVSPAQEYTLTVTASEKVEIFTFVGESTDPGVEGNTTQQVYDGTTVGLSVIASEGYELTLTVDGDDVTSQLDDSGWYEFIMPTHDVTVNATATAIPMALYVYSINGVESEAMVVAVGSTIDLQAGADLNSDFTFAGWTTDPNDVSQQLTDFTFNEENVYVFYAVYEHTTTVGAAKGNLEGATYEKVTSISDVTDGNYLIVYEEGSVAFNGSLETLDATNNTISVTISDSEIASSTETDNAIFTIAAIDGGYSIKSKSGYYIGNTKTGNKPNGLSTSIETVYVNSIEFENSNLSISSLNNNGITTLKYNSASDQKRFRFFGTGQQAIQLYKYTEGGVPTPTPVTTTAHYTRVFLANPTANVSIVGPSIIPNGITLNMGENELSNNLGAASFIIEDGAQYIGNSVEATVQKNIEACTYSQDNNAGYNLIASPVFDNLTAANVNGLLTNYYDLYKFDNTHEREWINYKAGAYTIDPEVGYLYASGSNTIIEFAGDLNEAPSSDVYDVTVAHKGFNLIGNPLPYNVAVVDEEFNLVDYQVLTSDGGAFEASSNDIAPCNAILVQTANDNETVYFLDPSLLEESKAVNIKLVENAKQVDNVRVRFGEGRGMNKFYLNNNISHVYFQQGNEEMAIVRSAAEAELPVSFRASENGTYTLAVEAENIDMNYLHLIDNMTGMDVDLLQTPSYTFEANTNDYANRFKLVFAANGTDEADESSFAFFSNGNLIVNNEGNATLQVIDINGRILSSETISGSCSKAINATTGVYMLRLINGDNVKVQKVVVR